MSTTAKLTVSSADLTSDKLSLALSTIIKKPGGDNVSISSGVQRISIAANTINSEALATARSYIQESTASATLGTNWFKNFLYVKNATVTAGQGTIMILSDGGDTNMGNASAGTCEVTSCDHAIATLEKDDWMFIPWPAYTDLHIQNKDGSNAASVEFMILG
tara:strand:+ start:1783 stop:2268 length:486 start_codon:yes stop_codon:yes gene_type:complete